MVMARDRVGHHLTHLPCVLHQTLLTGGMSRSVRAGGRSGSGSGTNLRGAGGEGLFTHPGETPWLEQGGV